MAHWPCFGNPSPDLFGVHALPAHETDSVIEFVHWRAMDACVEVRWVVVIILSVIGALTQ